MRRRRSTRASRRRRREAKEEEGRGDIRQSSSLIRQKKLIKVKHNTTDTNDVMLHCKLAASRQDRPTAGQLKLNLVTQISWTKNLSLFALCCLFASITCLQLTTASSPNSALKFEPETNSYSGLTFTFDPRLDKRVEWLHFEHWLAIVQQSSSLLYEALNGRAHLAEVRVLIPYKWRHVGWPLIPKAGLPIMMNRRLRYADSDILVGFEGK